MTEHGHLWGEESRFLMQCWVCLKCGFVFTKGKRQNDPNQAFIEYRKLIFHTNRFKLSCDEYLTKNVLES